MCNTTAIQEKILVENLYCTCFSRSIMQYNSYSLLYGKTALLIDRYIKYHVYKNVSFIFNKKTFADV